MKSVLSAALAALVLALPASLPAQDAAGLFESGRVRLVAEARVSDDDLLQGVLFQGPRCLAVDAKGNVYVSNFDANHVKVFGPDGKFLFVIGRGGQGPGEMQGPTLLAVSGDRLIVWETMNRRFSILGLDGRFIKTAPAVHGQMGDLSTLRALPGGRFAAVVDRGLPSGFKGRLPDERDMAVLLLSADLSPVSTVFERKLRNRAWTHHPETKGTVQVGFPFHPGVRADASPDGTIAAGLTQAYEIELIDPDKGRKGAIRREYKPLKVEARDKEAHFAQFKMIVFVNGQKSVVNKAPDYVRQLTEFPDALPPYRGIFYDGRGRLWVQLYTAERTNNVFDVFSAKGEYLNRITLENAPIDAAFYSSYDKAWAGDLLWRIEKDEDGYATLIKYRLTPAAK